jgi:hypothetical protein
MAFRDLFFSGRGAREGGREGEVCMCVSVCVCVSWAYVLSGMIMWRVIC